MASVKTVAVIGAGIMGRGIAHVRFADAEIVMPEELDVARTPREIAQAPTQSRAIIRVAAPWGEGWEYRRHGFLVSLPFRAGVARRACS